MIKILDKAEDRVKLHFMEDDSEDILGIDRDQWIQWLVSQTENGDMRIWANIDGKEITSYIVAYDCVDRPIADHVYVVYFWMDHSRGINEELLEKVKDWAKSIGAGTVQVATTEPDDFSRYDFLMSPERLMELKL